MLGFLSNDFGNQGGSDDDVDACNGQYHVTFQQFAIGRVTSPDGDGSEVAQPVFSWLAEQPNPGPSSSVEPTWNFHKYLISRKGELVAHWDSSVYPGDNPNDANDSFDTSEIVIAIKAELDKP